MEDDPTDLSPEGRHTLPHHSSPIDRIKRSNEASPFCGGRDHAIAAKRCKRFLRNFCRNDEKQENLLDIGAWNHALRDKNRLVRRQFLGIRRGGRRLGLVGGSPGGLGLLHLVAERNQH